jgi:hypothetical protein
MRRPALTREAWDAGFKAGKLSSSPHGAEDRSFQLRVLDWMKACFVRPDALDRHQRAFRFIEEALELVQAIGTSKEDVLRLVDYTYGRPPGEPAQEIGGVGLTLAAIATAEGLDQSVCEEQELTRCIANTEKIRAKDLAKPQRSPLPGFSGEPSENWQHIAGARQLEIDRLKDQISEYRDALSRAHGAAGLSGEPGGDAARLDWLAAHWYDNTIGRDPDGWFTYGKKTIEKIYAHANLREAIDSAMGIGSTPTKSVEPDDDVEIWPGCEANDTGYHRLDIDGQCQDCDEQVKPRECSVVERESK